jgi:hypothetical protein
MVEELTELKNLVIQALESNDSLSNIRAQIRSSVFKVVETQAPPTSKAPSPYSWENVKCASLRETPTGAELLQLVKDYLSFYSMDYSLSVFSCEANCREEVKKDALYEQLGAKGLKDKPLLAQIIEASKKK